MSTVTVPLALRQLVLLAALTIVVVAVPAASANEDETAESRYRSFARALDTDRIARVYAGAVEKLDADDSASQIQALKTLGATGEIDAIPWIVARLDAKDSDVRIWAGASLQRLVSAHMLRRRDRGRPSEVVIRPLGPDDTDLRPLAWVIDRMLRKPDDGNTHAYAATMIGYLDLREFADRLEALLKSEHPAVQNAAKSAMDRMGIDRPLDALEEQVAAARRTAESFGSYFLAADEDRFATLLLPERAMARVFPDSSARDADVEGAHRALIKANLTRFEELRSMLGDVSKFSVTGFEPGWPQTPKDWLMKDSYVVLACANRVIVRVKIEEMVYLEGECYIVKLD